MKIYKLLLVLGPACLSAAAVYAAVTHGASNASTSASEKERIELCARIDRASSEVRSRLHMPALIESDPEEQWMEEEIRVLYHSGWIIEASIEEVEAALTAAARTPTRVDDIAANRLAHRASCRFFFADTSAAETPNPVK